MRGNLGPQIRFRRNSLFENGLQDTARLLQFFSGHVFVYDPRSPGFLSRWKGGFSQKCSLEFQQLNLWNVGLLKVSTVASKPATSGFRAGERGPPSPGSVDLCQATFSVKR